MISNIPKHKVFISYYHEDDQEYKDRLIHALDSKAIDKSVSPGDIHDVNLSLDEIRRRIRDDHIADAVVTIVLVGPRTWQRKHIDWEVSASIIDRRNNERCGLLGLLLPTHPDHGRRPENRNPRLIPQRLARNIAGANPFAIAYDWPQEWPLLEKSCRKSIRHFSEKRQDRPWPDDSLGLIFRQSSAETSGGAGRIREVHVDFVSCRIDQG